MKKAIALGLSAVFLTVDAAYAHDELIKKPPASPPKPIEIPVDVDILIKKPPATPPEQPEVQLPIGLDEVIFSPNATSHCSFWPVTMPGGLLPPSGTCQVVIDQARDDDSFDTLDIKILLPAQTYEECQTACKKVISDNNLPNPLRRSDW